MKESNECLVLQKVEYQLVRIVNDRDTYQKCFEAKKIRYKIL